MQVEGNLQDARALYGQLREIFVAHPPGRASLSTLRQVEQLCEQAALACVDPYCRKKIQEAQRYAADYLSGNGHRRWARGPTSGTVFLRRLIFRALEAYDTRLTNLENTSK
ncbi:MAG TPA: hypothetical protein VFX67_07295 [Burkholderiales bacterium]|nr:hypothetical protein [Burkholderiales bacterium]